ncbi:hypothetical protein ACJ3XI_06060 [Litorimonas sp. RW-G-Af-16]
MIWLWIKGAHWAWGLVVICGVLILDPMWGLLARRLRELTPKK